MISEEELRKVVEQVLLEMSGKTSGAASDAAAAVSDMLPDIGTINLKEQINVPNPHNPDALKAMRKATPARITVWRAGPRYLTSTLLRFRADHATAMDAVFTDVSEDWITQNNLPSFRTKCENKDMFLTRPDLGRSFSDEELSKIKAHVGADNRVVIYIADGLSTVAVTSNAMDTYRAIREGLARHNIKPSAPFIVQYGRVGSQDAISEAVGAEVVVVLTGERPGLLTAESISAYMTYRAALNMPEARRTVISNIHKEGTPAVEAGSYISDIIIKMLDQKASGLDLKL